MTENAFYDELIIKELECYRNSSRPSVEETEKIILSWLSAYSYNGMELCRIINGVAPRSFDGCNQKVKDAGWNKPKNGCRSKERGCRICYQTIHGRLIKLHKDRKIRSITINSFDGRRPASTEIPTDKFRFWFINKDDLARRLHHDIETALGWVTY